MKLTTLILAILCLLVATPADVEADAASSASFTMVSHVISVAGGIQVSTSFIAESCATFAPSGTSTSTSFAVDHGCAQVTKDPIPVGLQSFSVN